MDIEGLGIIIDAATLFMGVLLVGAYKMGQHNMAAKKDKELAYIEREHQKEILDLEQKHRKEVCNKDKEIYELREKNILNLAKRRKYRKPPN